MTTDGALKVILDFLSLRLRNGMDFSDFAFFFAHSSLFSRLRLFRQGVLSIFPDRCSQSLNTLPWSARSSFTPRRGCSRSLRRNRSSSRWGTLHSSPARWACSASTRCCGSRLSSGWTLSLAYMFKGTGVVFGLLFAHYVFGETITTTNMVGAAIIICGITLYARQLFAECASDLTTR